MMIIFWVIIGFGIYYLLTNKNDVNLNLNRKEGPEEILKQRYVNGEINEETFENMLNTIRK